MKIWTVSRLNREAAAGICAASGAPQLAACVMAARGINTAPEALKLLPNGGGLLDPFLMKDMKKAVERIYSAIESGERICVYGDYDADGVCATALLFSNLSDIGANASYYIPSRQSEGYGMNRDAVDKIADTGATLIVTVDNGITAIDEIAYAASLGIDTVVTDHHKPEPVLPAAAAILNPHIQDCGYPFRELCGVGVAFKLAAALAADTIPQEELLDEYADLVAIGTVGDIVPLIGENRIFVKRGLKAIHNAPRTGIAALLECCAADHRKLSAGGIAYSVVPRINACGRLSTSRTAVEMLLSDDFELAAATAEELCEDNSSRRNIEYEITRQACEIIDNDPLIKNRRIIVVSNEGWNTGVVGIVASRLRELYGRPAIVIGTENGTAKGSGRSISGFSLVDAVFKCKDVLMNYGGHPMAVGVTLAAENINLFADMINSCAQAVGDMPYPELNIDLKLNPARLSAELVHELEYLEPYGAGNPQPLFGLYGMKLVSASEVGAGKHLKLVVSRGELYLTVMYFSHNKGDFTFETGDVLDLAVTLDINRYNDIESVSIILKDVKYSGDDTGECLRSLRIYEGLVTGENLPRALLKTILPSRDEFAVIYRKIRSVATLKTSLPALWHNAGGRISCGKIMVIIQALEELSLIKYISKGEALELSALDYGGKAELSSAPIIVRINKAMNGGIS